MNKNENSPDKELTKEDKKKLHLEVLDKMRANNKSFSAAIIQQLINIGHPCLTRIEPNLYLRITKPGTGFWVYQYKIHGKPKRMALGKFGKKPANLPLADARSEAANARGLINEGKDPLTEKNRAKNSDYKTVDHLALDWLNFMKTQVKHIKTPTRIYNQEIRPVIGDIALNDVTGLDIRRVLEFTRERKSTPRPTIVNDTLGYLKQIFDHGITLGVTHNNPANSFKTKHAGGIEKSRTRAPSLEEWSTVFSIMRDNQAHFVRDNYLAVALLLVLGPRKEELIGLPWDELDLQNKVWYLPAERAKNDYAIDIPLPDQAVEWFNELKVKAGNSKYVFPARRASKSGYISHDTLNHALTNLFGKKTGKLESSTGDVLGEAGIEYFRIHDIRRSTRTIMSKNKVRSEVAEKCINHVKKGVEGIYNQDAYFDERVAAHQQLADQIAPLVNQ
ncbi:tyrosine-type recombinase/integrase [Alteromonas sp. D210916BOD_24]|uniref:tyrosine-type recombinase/integrase n=1 Tax=Alteromonas sp. D210916BOD_24 TaxID=3157618 RepID=UPI00399CBB48